MCVPSTFYERPGVVTSSSSSNNTRKYTCMSQRKLPHKRWVTASFDALSQGKPERTEQTEAVFFQPLFYTSITAQMSTKNKDLFTIPKLDFLEQELQEQEQKIEELFLEFFKEDDITEFEEVEFLEDEFEPFEIEEVEFEFEEVEFEFEEVEFEFEEIEFEIKPLEEL